MTPAKIVAAIFVVAALGGGAYFYFSHRAPVVAPVVIAPEIPDPQDSVIGTSVQGRKIHAYTYGKGATRVVFVGGMAGGYEWNGALLAYQYMDYLDANPTSIPSDLSVTVIPELNVDGVFKATGKEGKFTQADVTTDTKTLAAARPNADGVDLNRNFDCNWKPTSMWQEKVVSAGKAPFSEPESAALRDFVASTKPVAAIFWHSQAGGVYGAECNNGILPSDTAIKNVYAKASGYPAVDLFTAYSITGDSEGWLASIGIPALTIELTNHQDTEWDKNLAGVQAILTYFKK
jgi:hypothetical protein